MMRILQHLSVAVMVLMVCSSAGADDKAGEQAPARIDAPASDGAVALSGKLPKPGKGWKKTDDGQTKGGMYSWVHFKHAESGDVLAFAATRNTASLKVEHSPIRQASIETFTHTGRASWSARSGSEPIADMIRNRIVTVSAGNATNDRKYREEAIEFSYVYEPSGDSPPNMAHGYVIVVGDLTVFVQHTSQKVITSELAADMVCGLLTKHLAEQTSIPKGWGVMIRRNKR